MDGGCRDTSSLRLGRRVALLVAMPGLAVATPTPADCCSPRPVVDEGALRQGQHRVQPVRDVAVAGQRPITATQASRVGVLNVPVWA